MMNTLANIGKHGGYWLALLLVGIAFEAVALYYQYALEEYPCVMCIHMRLWYAALVVLSLLVLVFHRIRAVTFIGHGLVALIAVGMLERSWQLLGVERGFILSECGFDLGLPGWFRPDEWWPAVFKVETTCGYTPELLFGITMAEGLLVFSAALLLVSVIMLIAAGLKARSSG